MTAPPTITLETSDIKRILHLAIENEMLDRRILANLYAQLVGPCILESDAFDSPFTVSPGDLGALTPILLRKARVIQ